MFPAVSFGQLVPWNLNLTIDARRFVTSRRKDAIAQDMTSATSSSWRLPATIRSWSQPALAAPRTPRTVEVVPLSSYRRGVLGLAVTSEVVLARAFPAVNNTHTQMSIYSSRSKPCPKYA